MKYKIKKITKKSKKDRGLVEFSSLYDFGIFSERAETDLVLYKKKTNKIAVFFNRIRRAVVRCFFALKERWTKKSENKLVLPALCGALVAVLCVMLFSFSMVGYKLFYQNYFGGYKKVTVPDLIGTVYPSDLSYLDLEYCNISVVYEYNDSAPAGVVMSQTPKPELVRRVYKNKSNCNVEIVVSLGKRTLVMPDLKGESVRDAKLALKNAGVSFSVAEVYSSSVDKGKVISTVPDTDESFYSDATVELVISLGEKKVVRTVPNIVGMNESQARAAIESAGLKVGKVSYKSSDKRYGVVLSQSIAAYFGAEEGEIISFCVSAGQSFVEKKIPELSSLSLDEAKERLFEVGLVIGRVYAVANAAKDGTVVAQFPPANTPITSDVYSVDVYVSS